MKDAGDAIFISYPLSLQSELMLPSGKELVKQLCTVVESVALLLRRVDGAFLDFSNCCGDHCGWQRTGSHPDRKRLFADQKIRSIAP